MNLTEINNELSKTFKRAIVEGVAQNKVTFESVLGLLELQKQSLLDWRRMAIAAQMEKEVPIIMPVRGPLPPQNGARQ